jgi:predicted metal-binding protein
MSVMDAAFARAMGSPVIFFDESCATADAVPRSTTSAPASLSVCARCRPADWRGPDTDRPGTHLADAIALYAGRHGLDVSVLRDVHCMSQCKRPCVVAFSGVDRFTYVFGDLDPQRDAPAVLDAFNLYRSRPDGFMERRERPLVMREGILGRVPPLTSDARFVRLRPHTRLASVTR